MEEILASIRRIIHEGDDDQGAETETEAEEMAPDSVDEDVLELTEMVNEDGSVVSLSTAKEEPRPGEAEGQDEPGGEGADTSESAAGPMAEVEAGEESLVSEGTAAAAAGSLAELARALGKEPDGTDEGRDASGGAPEELIKETIRPMLKEWLDRNLPDLVERLVKKELAKVVRRAEDQ